MNHFTHYTQLDAMDCGPTCLRMIAKHYGRSYTLHSLRERSYITLASILIAVFSVYNIVTLACRQRRREIAVRHDMNICFADFYDILHQEGPRLSQTEKMVAVCYLLGFNAEESEELLNISDNYIRVSKFRLKKKLPTDFYDLVFLNSERTAVD